MESKPCSKCKRVLPLDSFHADPKMKLGRRSSCKECCRAVTLAWQERNPEYKREYMAQWRRDNADRLREKKREWAATRGREIRYGLAPGEYDRMHEDQSGRCAICGDPGDNLCVDHCHESGAIRGLLCQKCNTGIGMLRDDLFLVRKAALYLEKYEDAEWRSSTAGTEHPLSQLQ